MKRVPRKVKKRLAREEAARMKALAEYCERVLESMALYEPEQEIVRLKWSGSQATAVFAP